MLVSTVLSHQSRNPGELHAYSYLPLHYLLLSTLPQGALPGGLTPSQGQLPRLHKLMPCVSMVVFVQVNAN